MHYIINIIRSEPKSWSNQGTLRYQHKDVVINTPCWWRLKRIAAGWYVASATRMNSRFGGRTGKKREAIFFHSKAKLIYPFGSIPFNPYPKGYKEALPTDNGTPDITGAFIHKGSDPEKSDGCIVANDDAVFRIWESIEPKDGQNVFIHIKDLRLYGPPR